MFVKMPQTNLADEKRKSQNSQRYHTNEVNTIKRTEREIQMFIMVIMYK
jgi:hypothetical protein